MMFDHQIHDSIVNKDQVLKLDVTLSYDDKTQSILGYNPKLKIQCWEDDIYQSICHRAAQLGSYLNFEDLYLIQDDYRYFHLYFDDSDVSKLGTYVIEVNVNNLSYSVDKTALYKIDGSYIERILIEVVRNGVIRFKIDSLGLFALAPFTHLKETKKGQYREELHHLLDGQEVEIWYDKPVGYNTSNSTVTIVNGDLSDDKGGIFVSKDKVSDDIKDALIKYFKSDEDEQISEDIIKDRNLLETIDNHVI